MPTVNVEALKCTVISSGGALQRSSLQFGNPHDLKRAKEDGFPVVYVISTKDLPRFREHPDFILDRGRKNRHKGLSEYFLDLPHDKIPVIDGNYGSPGQLQRSIRDFLERVQRKGESNLYIIGVSESILYELWVKAGMEKKENLSRRNKEQKKETQDTPQADKTPIECLLEQITRYPEPHDLREHLVGQSAEIRLVRQLILHAAKCDDPVLVLGDTGTGKEVVAREIHKYSGRKNEGFIAVNCGAIPSELFESELFGITVDAGVGLKKDKVGLWKKADNGTLFLDEIAELLPNHQTKVLRAIEDKKIRPVGGIIDEDVNARIVAATNRDLFSMVKAGKFREDLYYRLRGFFVHTPAIRDHPEDIPRLAQALWNKMNPDAKKALPQEIIDELLTYRWPGNARELKMVLSNLRALFGTENLNVNHLKAVFILEGHGTTIKDELTPENEFFLHRAGSLHHLKHIDEALHAIIATVKSIAEGQKSSDQIAAAHSTLCFRLNYLEMLLQKEALFHSNVCFNALEKLKGDLIYFTNLLRDDTARAQHYWEDTLSGEYKNITLLLHEEEIKLLDKA